MRRKKEKRMRSFVTRGNALIKDGKMPEAVKIVEDGLTYYSNNIIAAISPYAVADAGLLVVALRHIADEVEGKNKGAKELAEYLQNTIKKKPQLIERTEVKKPNMH